MRTGTSRWAGWINVDVVLYDIMDTQTYTITRDSYNHQHTAQSCLEGCEWQLAVAVCARAEAGYHVVLSPRELTTTFSPEETPPALEVLS